MHKKVFWKKEATQVQKISQTSLLLESLGVSACLALVGSLPGEVALEELLVSGVAKDVQWRVLVALEVWGNIDDWLPERPKGPKKQSWNDKRKEHRVRASMAVGAVLRAECCFQRQPDPPSKDGYAKPGRP